MVLRLLTANAKSWGNLRKGLSFWKSSTPIMRSRFPRDRKDVTEREVADIEERAQPRTPVIYEVVRRLGEEEMRRLTLVVGGCGGSFDQLLAFGPGCPLRHGIG
jgi:hypothetical protein